MLETSNAAVCVQSLFKQFYWLTTLCCRSSVLRKKTLYWSELVDIALYEDYSFPVQDWGLAMAILTYGSYSSFIAISFFRCCAGLIGNRQNPCAPAGHCSKQGVCCRTGTFPFHVLNIAVLEGIVFELVVFLSMLALTSALRRNFLVIKSLLNNLSSVPLL